jgi:hypothetical protein
MELDHAGALAIAQRYFDTTDTLTRLGWGISGFVYLSPTLNSVVKVHRYDTGFWTEVRAYQRLRRLRISKLFGLTIPTLKDFRSDLKLIQMDFVSAPYLLDFAGVKFKPLDYPEDTMRHWHEQIEERFGPNAGIAYDVYHALGKHGIYYDDFRQSNMNLTGLEGLLPWEPSAEDDP